MTPPKVPKDNKTHFVLKVQRPLAEGLVTFENGAIYDCQGGGTPFNSSLVLRAGKWYYKLPPPTKPPRIRLKHIPGTLVSLCFAYGHSYQHAMLDAFPRLSLALPFLIDHPDATVLHGTGAKSLMELASFPKTISAKGSVAYTADRVVVPIFYSDKGALSTSEEGSAVALRERIMQKLLRQGSLPRGHPSTVLYLRRAPGMTRSVAGETQLLSMMRAWMAPGFKLKVFEHRRGARIEEDAAEFWSAKVVIGPHGGAMGNLVFANPEAHVVEFLPMAKMRRVNDKANIRPCYFYLSRALNLTYWMVEPDNFDFDSSRFAMRVNPQDVITTLRKIGVARGRP